MQQQYALVYDGAVLIEADGSPVITPFMDEKPNGHSDKHPVNAKWFEVESVDSEPFIDKKRQYRGLASYEVRGNKVARVYEIVTVRK